MALLDPIVVVNPDGTQQTYDQSDPTAPPHARRHFDVERAVTLKADLDPQTGKLVAAQLPAGSGVTAAQFNEEVTRAQGVEGQLDNRVDVLEALIATVAVTVVYDTVNAVWPPRPDVPGPVLFRTAGGPNPPFGTPTGGRYGLDYLVRDTDPPA